MTKKKQELPPERPPDEPTNLAEWLWRVKQYEGSIYVRELDNGHWKTIALGCLPPKEWAAQVARMLEAGIVPTRIRDEGKS
jgi:hypothetical protein